MCGNCLKHGACCDFALPATRPADIVSIASTPALNLLDLELLHNFTSSTCNTLSSSFEVRSAWRTAVVRKALHCDYVMHALLAVSGTHMAHHRSDEKHHYLLHATRHHDIATHAAIPLMVNLIPENIESLWIFSILTMYFALGSPRETDPYRLHLGDSILPNWIPLFHGVHKIFNMLESTSYTGILSPLLKHSSGRQNGMYHSQHACSDVFKVLTARINDTVSDDKE